jgi:hypothetical protein
MQQCAVDNIYLDVFLNWCVVIFTALTAIVVRGNGWLMLCLWRSVDPALPLLRERITSSWVMSSPGSVAA